jgi:hypothetical protein
MLSQEELQLVLKLEGNLRNAIQANEEKYRYYYQKLTVKDLGISTPPSMRWLKCILGWASAAVDCIEERIFFRGFYSPTNNPVIEKLNELYRLNDIEVQQRIVAKDMFITGSSYISVGVGGEGEAEVIQRAESPNEVYGDYNFRKRELDNALKVVRMETHYAGTLWLPNVTIQLTKSLDADAQWTEVERDEHNLGRVTVVNAMNEADSLYRRGRTEISPSLRSHVDAGMRVILNTETSREFFASPLRAITGADKEDFMDEEGNPVGAWDMIASKIVVIPASEDGAPNPTMIQLPASNPENIMNLIEPFARLAAREIGVPPSYFGFESTNPSSADALNAADAKLLHRVAKRQPEIGRAWKLANEYAQLLLNGEVIEDWADTEAVFARPEAASPAASADRLTKLQATGVFDRLLPDFVYVELGFREVEILQLKQWLQQNAGQDLVKTLLATNANTAATETTSLPPTQPVTIKPVEPALTETGN